MERKDQRTGHLTTLNITFHFTKVELINRSLQLPILQVVFLYASLNPDFTMENSIVFFVPLKTKPIQDCNPNDLPLNVDCSDWYLDQF